MYIKKIKIYLGTWQEFIRRVGEVFRNAKELFYHSTKLSYFCPSNNALDCFVPRSDAKRRQG